MKSQFNFARQAENGQCRTMGASIHSTLTSILKHTIVSLSVMFTAVVLIELIFGYHFIVKEKYIDPVSGRRLDVYRIYGVMTVRSVEQNGLIVTSMLNTFFTESEAIATCVDHAGPALELNNTVAIGRQSFGVLAYSAGSAPLPSEWEKNKVRWGEFFRDATRKDWALYIVDGVIYVGNADNSLSSLSLAHIMRSRYSVPLDEGYLGRVICRHMWSQRGVF